MRILLVSEVFPPKTGGSGRWFWEVYRRLPREECLIVAGEHPQAKAFDETHDLNVIRLPLKLPSWGIIGRREVSGYYGLYRRLGKLARQHGVTAVHAGCSLPEGFLAYLLWRTGRLSYLVFVHGEELRIAASSRELGWMTRRALGAAAAIVANSENTAAMLRDDWGIRSETIRVVHPGVDANRFVPAPRDFTLRRRMGWDDRPVVLTVGRLQKRKGHDMMIRALPIIVQSRPDLLYAIVGDGEERGALEALTVDLGLQHHVRFHGEPADDELVGMYQQCDLFALPNREVNGDIEGFGMVLLEAQACGKPVIAGNSGGTAETMKPGETGLVVDCTAPEPLAEAVVRLTASPDEMRVMGSAAREWVHGQFHWGALVEEFRSVCDRMSNVRAQQSLSAALS